MYVYIYKYMYVYMCLNYALSWFILYPNQINVKYRFVLGLHGDNYIHFCQIIYLCWLGYVVYEPSKEKVCNIGNGVLNTPHW